MNTRKLLGSLTLVALLGMAACSDGASSKAVISKADFLTKGNALCTTFNATSDAAQANITTEDEQIAFINDTLVPGIRSTVASIRALGFPKGDEALLSGLMDDTEAKLTEIEADPAAAVAAGVDPFADINTQLAAYGLTVCGQAG